MMQRRQITLYDMSFTYLEHGEGPTVFCFHGFPDTAMTWRDLIDDLAGAGYRVIAPYMRGYRPTDLAPDDRYGSRQLAQDVLGFVDALGGDTPGTVIGHDWGAQAVWTAASLAPERIGRMVMMAVPPAHTISPSLSVAWGVRHFFLFQLRRLTLARIRRDPRAFLRSIYARWSPAWDFDDAELEDVLRAWEDPASMRAAIAYYWEMPVDVRDRDLQRALQHPCSIPTLLIGGGADGALDAKQWQRAPSAFDGPCRLEIVEDGGHFLHREQPEDVHTILREWLASTPKP